MKCDLVGWSCKLRFGSKRQAFTFRLRFLATSRGQRWALHRQSDLPVSVGSSLQRHPERERLSQSEDISVPGGNQVRPSEPDKHRKSLRTALAKAMVVFSTYPEPFLSENYSLIKDTQHRQRHSEAGFRDWHPCISSSPTEEQGRATLEDA